MSLISVLYVDDEPALLETTKLSLERKPGFSVDTALSASEALNLLKTREYDLIISDYQMPEMDGIQFLKLLRNAGNAIPFILFTGRGREEVVVDAYNAGADSYIIKGGDSMFLFMDLARKIEQIVNCRKMEQELRFNNTLLSTQQETSPDGILVVDTYGTIVSFNTRFMEMWNIPEGTLSAGLDEDALPSVLGTLTDPAGFLESMKYLYHHRDEKSHDEIILKDTRIFDRYSAPMVGNDGSYYGRVWYFRDITARKQAEEALRESEEKFRMIFENSNDAILLMEVPGEGGINRILDVNDAVLRQTGYTKEELLSRTAARIESPDLIRKLPSTLAELFASGSVTFESEVFRKDGSLLPVELSINFVKYKNIPCMISTARDITRRKQAEEALRESELMYRTLIESANEGIFVIQNDFIPFANPKALEIIGHSADELAGKHFLELVHPDDRQEIWERYMRRIHGEVIESVAYSRIIDRINSIHWLEINAVRILWNGRPATLNFVTDITRRRHAEEALRLNEEKYRTVIENIQDVFYRTDKQGVLVMISPSLKAVLGYDSIEECLGQPFAEMFYYQPEKRQEFLEILQKNGSVKDYEVILKRKDGSPVTVATSSKIYYDESGNVQRVEGVFRDITERKQVEAALVESLHEKELLLKEIHHRVKNNLQTISSLLYLQSLSTDDAEQISLLREARSRVISMGLIHQKLYQSADIAHIQFMDYIRSLIDFLEESYGVDPEEIQTLVEVNPFDLMMELDTGIPCGLIINELVTNSLKYAFHGRGSGTIQVRMERDEHEYLLTVSDDGWGIPAGLDLSTVKSLGMTLVTDLVSQLEGSFEIIHQPGVTYRIRFPYRTMGD